MTINLNSPINMGHVQNRGLVACYPMLRGTFTGKRIRDVVNRKDMTVGSGATFSMLGPTKRGMRFSSGSMTVPSGVFKSIDGVGKISVGLWINPFSISSYRAVFDSTNRDVSFLMNAATDLYVGFGGSAGGVTSSISFTTHEWQYVLITYDGLNVNVYRNGAFACTRTLGNTVFTDAVQFGANPSGGGSSFDGLQSGWRIWNRTLTAADAMALYKQAKVGFRDMYNYLKPIAIRELPPDIVIAPASYAFTPNNLDLILGYGIETDVTTYAFTPVNVNLTAGYRIDLAPASYVFTPNPINLYTSSDEGEEKFIGRFRRGQKVTISVIPTRLPIAVPEIDFWLEGTTKVKTVKLPVKNRALPLFSSNIFLDANFPDGHYVAVIKYQIGINQCVAYQYFDVVGGDSVGSVVGVTEIRRPLGKAIVTQRDDGNIAMGYRPRLE